MKKVFIALAVIIVLLGGVVYFVFTNLDKIVETAIETAGSQALGTPVEVGSVELNLMGGTAAMWAERGHHVKLVSVTNGDIGHMGWSHNYPSSDRNFNEFIRNATGVDVDIESYRIVELGSPEVFNYPFAYVSEPGEMALTDVELANLREFVNRGGFVLIDDFDGSWQLENMRSELLRAFPSQPLVALTPEHGVFNVHFNLNDLDRMSPYVPGGHITYFAMSDNGGALAIAAGHNNDLANFWDWYDEARYPLEPAADAFRLGINFVIWSMTH